MAKQVFILPYFEGTKLNYKETLSSLKELTKPTQVKFDAFMKSQEKKNEK